LLSVLISADETPPGSFSYPESAARALGLAAQRAEWLRRPAGSIPEVGPVDAAAARAVVEAALAGTDDVWLDTADARALLDAYGIPLVPEARAETPTEAVARARELGFPVVVKTAAAGAHKTESGGVALDLRTPEEVEAAAERIGGPVLVQPLIRGATELLAGAIQDPVFGPLVAFGPGGVHAELIGDAQFALAPLRDVDVSELLGAGKAARLVAGWRGSPPADRDALADLLHRLGRLAADQPHVVELDLNPIIADADGCIAVDARVRVRRQLAVTSRKTW
jgi:acyl-CoA synthetase (NDP forming)